ncbi:MAG TPA: iron-sulfur cluster assembly protein [Nocardioidaceae bacterium]|nr:iron-sulfur cluster assembly protein [Nocardioidaceae bacterium]
MTVGTPPRVDVAAIDAALGTVRDPELDESITSLDFVGSVAVDGGIVTVELRLPTYFCAPNFAYLMVADAYDAVVQVPGVESVIVRLLDHFASDEINAGVAARRGFAGSFPGLADDELAELRLTFRRKAHRAGQERCASALVRAGRDVADLAAASLGDVPPGPDLDRLRRRRLDLGLPAADDAPLLVDDDGTPITVVDLPAQLRLARTTRISIDGNAAFCRGLLDVRYGRRDEGAAG